MIISFRNQYFHLFQTLLHVVVVIETATVDKREVLCPCYPNCDCSSSTYNGTTCCIDCKSMSHSTEVLNGRNLSLNYTYDSFMRNGNQLIGNDDVYGSPENVRSATLAEERNDLDCADKLCRACEHTNVTLKCHTGRIKVLSANYGRTEIDICGHYNVINCSANQSLSIVSSRCDGERNCSVNASNNVFGDPCYGTFKYLDICFKCQPNEGDVSSSAPAHTTVTTGLSTLKAGTSIMTALSQGRRQQHYL
ncbi:uncharacterized protein [Ptychodera flava]|uniref:uncharacterized protein n=1 Tax=Ptychodera flava TaxID=63121 RepID=UPI003969D8B7